ncbi:flagellar protein export ATPase FliI [Photobacterium gaetbulicola]|uniref:Flagellum-specific ATP synthase n=2 Tax=Photobacterium gaetbulicola TaxID=1295392 RepID=A0A0C5WKV8_9GAMM|nr:flagellar protein export ATPase FliI [Photobacterium gaetbulicola]AJR07788.1 flagellum-specific ATP synthase [Photobacterium gaetbulicola Gung47]KHT62911.1 ATP synthase [Photobacterium gaetbulicola]PSU03416.1 flagellar protein export ATPase FliI [Photobacterium gaetbulicola]
MSNIIDYRLEQALASLDSVPVAKVTGRLVKVTGLMLEAVGCRLLTGQRCLVETGNGTKIEAQTVGFNRDVAYLMPVSNASGLFSGAKVWPLDGESQIRIGPQWLGRVLNGLGEPLDRLGPVLGQDDISLESENINPMSRRPIDGALDVGIRAINSLLTLGKGQRIGLFAGSGVGKSVLLGMITRQTSADVVVVGLIGERGREVKEFIEHSLGPEGLARAVVIAAPADESPLMRLRASQLCHRVAEYYRDQGKDVLLLMDSLTRFAMAQREIALALGEPPATKGYPPSVFSMLPQLVERAGNSASEQGSMSAIYTVLTEGDDQQDPIADSARAILDGHVVLNRQLAEAGHYPAIDISQSISRTMPQVVSKEQLGYAMRFKRLYSRYQEVRELIPLGGYQPGNDPEMDQAVMAHPKLVAFLQQAMDEKADWETVNGQMTQLIQELNLG